MKASLAFAFFLLFLAGIALVNLGSLRPPSPAELEPPDPADLVAQRWRLAAMRGADAAYDSGVELLFTRGGLLTAEGACNHYAGSYSLTDGTLAVEGMAGTRLACPEREMGYDAALLAVLEATAAAATDGTSLVLLSADGERLARFRAALPDNDER